MATAVSNFARSGVRWAKTQLTRKHWVYISCHLILSLIGIIIMSVPGTGPTIDKLIKPIGGSLLAMGIGGTVLFLKVWIDQAESDRIKDIREFGLRRIFPFRSVAIRSEYDARLSRVSEAIDIIGYGLNHLREDHAGSFSTWATRAKVRILVIDPEFPSKESCMANLRDLEEGHDVGKICGDVMKLIRCCAPLIQDQSKDFQIRLYRCLPSINLFRIDANIFWGPYFIGDVSRNMPTFLMEADGRLSDNLREHFERIWTSDEFSRAIPEDWLDMTSHDSNTSTFSKTAESDES